MAWPRPGSKKSGRADALGHVPPTAAFRGGGPIAPEVLTGVERFQGAKGAGVKGPPHAPWRETIKARSVGGEGGRYCTDGQEPGFGHPSVYLDLAHLRNRIQRRPTWLWRRRAFTPRHHRPHGFMPPKMECTPGSEEAEEPGRSAFHVRWCKMDGGRYQSQGSISHAGARAVTTGG